VLLVTRQKTLEEGKVRTNVIGICGQYKGRTKCQLYQQHISSSLSLYTTEADKNLLQAFSLLSMSSPLIRDSGLKPYYYHGTKMCSAIPTK
jgi:hypothetical protein